MIINSKHLATVLADIDHQLDQAHNYLTSDRATPSGTEHYNRRIAVLMQERRNHLIEQRDSWAEPDDTNIVPLEDDL